MNKLISKLCNLPDCIDFTIPENFVTLYNLKLNDTPYNTIGEYITETNNNLSTIEDIVSCIKPANGDFFKGYVQEEVISTIHDNYDKFVKNKD